MFTFAKAEQFSINRLPLPAEWVAIACDKYNSDSAFSASPRSTETV
jgi:hypothetical protein